MVATIIHAKIAIIITIIALTTLLNFVWEIAFTGIIHAVFSKIYILTVPVMGRFANTASALHTLKLTTITTIRTQELMLHITGQHAMAILFIGMIH